MQDSKAAVVGGVVSILGINIIGFVGDAIISLVLGGIGALGGYLVNKLIKYIEKKRNELNKKI